MAATIAALIASCSPPGQDEVPTTGSAASPASATKPSPPSPSSAPQSDRVRQAPCGEKSRLYRGIDLSTRYRCYGIAGRTAGELIAEMDRLGPGVHHAFTKWRVEWHFLFSSRDLACGIDSADVTVDMVFTFPRWENPAGASPDLVEAWNDYIDALMFHESGHRSLAVEAGQRIHRRLTTFGESCSTLESSANKVGQSIIQEQRRREDQYDERTNHGATQGVRLHL